MESNIAILTQENNLLKTQNDEINKRNQEQKTYYENIVANLESKAFQVDHTEFQKKIDEIKIPDNETIKFYHLQGNDKEDIKAIILELFEPKEYKEDNYPFLEYFMLTKYSTEETFMNEFNKINKNKELYPIISLYLNQSKKNPKSY